MTIKEAKLFGLLMIATEKHKMKRSNKRIGTNVRCSCEACNFVAFIWKNFIWIEDLKW